MAPDEQSDAELAGRAARGDRHALEQLLARHVDRVHAICRRVVVEPHAAEDATQEALISIARSITRFDGRSAFSTWVYRIATNASLDELRRRARRPIPTDVLTDLPSGAPSLADGVADRLDAEAALADLPPEFRAAVALRDLCDLDYRQIGEMLGVPPGTVRSRIARGRAAIADRLRSAQPSIDRNQPAVRARPREQR